MLMVMQVHDGRLLEVPSGELDWEIDPVTAPMTGAAMLKVRVLAEVGSMPNADQIY